MESNEDDFQSTFKQKSKSQSKRKNKLSSKHRSKSQKIEDGNNEEGCDLFSPVSCTLSRKTSRTGDMHDVIVISDDESCDSSKPVNEHVICKDKQLGSEGTETQVSSLLGNEWLNDKKQTVSPDRCCNKSQLEQKCENKENRNLLLINKSDTTNNLKTTNELFVASSESSQFECDTPCNRSVDDFIPKYSAIISSDNRKLEESDNEIENCLIKNISLLPNSSVDCEISKSTETGCLSTKTDQEHTKKVVEISQGSNKSIKDTFGEEKEQIDDPIQDKNLGSALGHESLPRSLSLEHLNDCTPDDGQENTSETKHKVNPGQNVTSEDTLLSHSDSKKLTFSCPLCWKTFENSQSHMLHMKECASRHNLTTRQLLDALELQEKQSAERLALGLPDVPIARMVKKSTAKKKTETGKDNNLQLALALSVSLQEAEEKEQIEKDQHLIEAGLGYEVVERQKTMLERFGFTSSRPPLPPSTNSRTKQGNKNKNTVLIQRNKEERERLITEKVGIILVGEEQDPSSSFSSENVHIPEKPLGMLDCLQKYETKSNLLWNAVTSSCDEEQNHYVEGLSNLISPCKIKAGDKIKHLSQIADRDVTPIKEVFPVDISNLHASVTPQSNQEQEKLPDSSMEVKTRENLHDLFKGKDKSENRLAEKFISDWRSMLNKKAMSDVKIFLKFEDEIPGHKLVFYTRCRSIYRDIIIEKKQHGKSESTLMWDDVSFRAAIAFLQFIYCGRTSKILRLNENDLLSVKGLAERYKVLELLEHLKIMDKVSGKVENQAALISSHSHRKSVTESKNCSVSQDKLTPNKIGQSEIVTERFSKHYSESALSLSEESSPVHEDELPVKSPSKYCSEINTCKRGSTFKEDYGFSNLDGDEQFSHSYSSKKSAKLSSESNHISDSNVICPEQTTSLGHSHADDINKISSCSTSMTENKNNVDCNYEQDTVRSGSPDLFMPEENTDVQATNDELSEQSTMNIKNLLRMFDLCLTQNSQEGTSNEKSHVGLNSPSSVINENKNTSPNVKNKSLPNTPIDETMNYAQELKVNKSPNVKNKSLPNTPIDKSMNYSQDLKNKSQSPNVKNKSLPNPPIDESMNYSQELKVNKSQSKKDSIRNKTDKTLSLSPSLHNYIESYSSSQKLLSTKYGNSSKATEKDFDCIDFLENLISDSPSKTYNEHVENGNKQRSTDSKRRYSERDSSSDRSNTKRPCRKSLENEINILCSQEFANENLMNHSKKNVPEIIDTLDLTQDNDELDNSQSYLMANDKAENSYFNESYAEQIGDHLTPKQENICNKASSNRIIDSINEPGIMVDVIPSELNIKTTVVTSAVKGTLCNSKMDDWDSFDEMCNASEPEIFSQGLTKLLTSQSISPRADKSQNKNSSQNKSSKENSKDDLVIKYPQRTKSYDKKSTNQRVSLENTLMACLNDSILWKEENAPRVKSSEKNRNSALLLGYSSYRTPTQQKSIDTENVTPPASYSTMKTPDLKKELDKYGLKPSLSKKQAKIMLRYIYDQLHPFITENDSEEDSKEEAHNSLLPSPFKIPDKNTHVPKSPTKKLKKTSVSRSLMESKGNKQTKRNLAFQIDTSSDNDELSSQESSSSSTIDIAEEMLVEDLEGCDIPDSQDVCSSDDLPTVVQHYITTNPDLHQKVLQHEPIWLEEFLKELKAQNYKFKKDRLMDYFDEQCITFRTVQGHKSRMKKRERNEAKKKKSSPKKKRSKSAASSSVNNSNSSSN